MTGGRLGGPVGLQAVGVCGACGRGPRGGLLASEPALSLAEDLVLARVVEVSRASSARERVVADASARRRAAQHLHAPTGWSRLEAAAADCAAMILRGTHPPTVAPTTQGEVGHDPAAPPTAARRRGGSARRREVGQLKPAAKAGGSARHNFLSGAMIAELRAALQGRGCHVLTSDQRIGVAPGSRYVYADAVVACGGVRMEPGTSDVLANPTIVVEVLSQSTALYDRGDKWDAYQRVPSLTDYVLVSQATAVVEHYHREADGSWRYRMLEAGASLTLDGASIAVDAVYEGAFALPGD